MLNLLPLFIILIITMSMSAGFTLPLLTFFILTMALSAAFTYLSLPVLRRLGKKQSVREDVPETHLEKAGTPSMGGVPMLLAIILMSLFVAGFAKGGKFAGQMLAVLGVCVAYAGIGLADDLCKLGNKKSRGIPARYRLAMEIAVAAVFTWLCVTQFDSTANLLPSWIGSGNWVDGFVYVLGIFTIVGGSNALNLTDGLDGLAAGLTCIAALAMTALGLILHLPVVMLISIIVAGGSAGFLILNKKPAKVWMGDVGSLSLGALLTSLAVLGRIEIVFALVGIIFVAEAMSVILQVISFKSTGKRIFRMAPLHHHFELGGLKEIQVVTRFWIVGQLAAILAIYLTIMTNTPPPA